MPSWLAPLIDWLNAHPQWAGALIASITFAESLAFIGVIVPGVVMLFSIMALIGASDAPLLPILAWAWVGAVLGDQLSYWLGWRFKESLWHIWPLNRQPNLRAKSEIFTQRWGGLAVVLGRFVGPIRPIIPVIAGMSKMPPWRFTWINLLSAVAWAPVYILPGAVLGASLDVAGSVAAKIIVLMCLLALLIWLLIWAAQHSPWRYFAAVFCLATAGLTFYTIQTWKVPVQQLTPIAADNLEKLQLQLAEEGWQLQQPRAKDYLFWFNSTAEWQDLPALPVLHKNNLAVFTATQPLETNSHQRLVQYFWLDTASSGKFWLRYQHIEQHSENRLMHWFAAKSNTPVSSLP